MKVLDGESKREEERGRERKREEENCEVDGCDTAKDGEYLESLDCQVISGSLGTILLPKAHRPVSRCCFV
jgi:hypothetical protein